MLALGSQMGLEAGGCSRAWADLEQLVCVDPSLDRKRRLWFSGERAVELDARADVELGEDLVEVVFDGPRADE
jgi:hypothetical protein